MRFFVELIFKGYKLKPGRQFARNIQMNYHE
ncbi:MAG: hypothetical protein JWM99_5228 [Verrucomicrobiales bacterium]|nr:hypothetical protein [Verrucomicrobiales bacterium]